MISKLISEGTYYHDEIIQEIKNILEEHPFMTRTVVEVLVNKLESRIPKSIRVNVSFK